MQPIAAEVVIIHQLDILRVRIWIQLDEEVFKILVCLIVQVLNIVMQVNFVLNLLSLVDGLKSILSEGKITLVDLFFNYLAMLVFFDGLRQVLLNHLQVMIIESHVDNLV